MKRRLTLAVFAVAATGISVAAPVDSVAAAGHAAAFLRALRPARAATAVQPLPPIGAGGAAYAFTDGAGTFVLVAADDRLPAVLAYGQTGTTVPPALSALLDSYAGQLATAPATRAASTVTTPAVSPLLASVRDQYDPFNRTCPLYTDDAGHPTGQRCIVGCVATAFEQVLTHYRQPAALRDTVFAHSSAHFTTTDVLPATPIDWTHIRDRYEPGAYTDAEARAVADLSLWCGQMVKMQWSPAASGAYLRDIVPAARRVLGYGYAHYADSYKYRPADWRAMLIGELREGRPVIYAGSTYAMSAHAFVLDGVDTEGRFHVNWGYGGAYDGYFRLDVLAPAAPDAQPGTTDQSQGFFCNQEAVLLHPDAVNTALPDTLRRTGREFSLTSLRFERRPDTNDAVAVRLGLRNTADEPLTTPIALLTLPERAEQPMDKAERLCYTGVSLAAGADTVITAYARFLTGGRRQLLCSADGVTAFHSQPVDIAVTAAAQPEVADIRLNASADSLAAAITFHNAATEGWSGDMPTFSLFEGSHDSGSHDVRRYAHLNLAPGADTTVVVRFGGLRPATHYDFCVRIDWPIVAHREFTTPPATAITSRPQADAPALWFTPDGRPTARPTRPGIYIERRGTTTRKVAIPAP